MLCALYSKQAHLMCLRTSKSANIEYICCQGRKTDIARQSHLMLQGACRAQLCFKEEFAEHF